MTQNNKQDFAQNSIHTSMSDIDALLKQAFGNNEGFGDASDLIKEMYNAADITQEQIQIKTYKTEEEIEAERKESEKMEMLLKQAFGNTGGEGYSDAFALMKEMYSSTEMQQELIQVKTSKEEEKKEPVKKDFSYFFKQGESFFSKKDYDIAVLNYKLAFKQNPKDKNIVKRIADCYFKKDKYSNALELYRKIEPLFDDIEITQHISECYLNLGQLEKALTYFKRIENKDSKNHNNLINLAKYYLKKDELEVSLSYCLKYTEFYEENEDNLNITAEIYKKKELYENAMNCYQKILFLDKANYNALINLAELFFIKADRKSVV